MVKPHGRFWWMVGVKWCQFKNDSVFLMLVEMTVSFRDSATQDDDAMLIPGLIQDAEEAVETVTSPGVTQVGAMPQTI